MLQGVLEFYDFTFPSCVLFFYLTSAGIYFLFIRGLLASCVIKERRMTKKERKLQQEQRWNRSKKEALAVFGKWILCKTYTDEQKKGGYGLFVIYNHVYLAVAGGYLILSLLSFVIEPLRFWCIIFTIVKMNILDYPVLLVLGILFVLGKIKRTDT